MVRLGSVQDNDMMFKKLRSMVRFSKNKTKKDILTDLLLLMEDLDKGVKVMEEEMVLEHAQAMDDGL